MNIKVGKFTLETLTTGMYDSPKDIYREYIQNAVDSIDNAIEQGILRKGNDSILIRINNENSSITITDNGTGINSDNALTFLLNIGDSIKIKSNNRGFRGIGRLAGLAYCDKLSFATSYYGEEIKTIIVFNAKELRDKLYTLDTNDTLEDILRSVISTTKEYEAKSKHYFSVELVGVSDVDNILNDREICDYLSQVAPVPFSPDFKWKDIITSKLQYRGFNIGEYNIVLEGKAFSGPVYKKYKDKFIADRIRKVEDNIDDIKDMVFVDGEGNALAYLWYAETNYYGTIQNDLIKSIRLRKGNIQLGAKNVLNSIFRDERFNGWLIGELHIVSQKLIPNARRDNLEKTEAYYNLQEQLKEWADTVSATIRKISVSRNSEKANKRIEEIIESAPTGDLALKDVELIPEINIYEKREYDDVAHTELINQLDILISQKHVCTKYNALNIQTGLTVEEKHILENVFDILQDKYSDKADGLISLIIKEYKVKSLSKR